MSLSLPQLPSNYTDYYVFTSPRLDVKKVKDVVPEIKEISARYLLKNGLLFKDHDDIMSVKNEIIRILTGPRKTNLPGYGELYPQQVEEFVQHSLEDNLILLSVEDVTQDLYTKYICGKDPSPQTQALFDDLKERLEFVRQMIMKATKKRTTRLYQIAEKQRV